MARPISDDTMSAHTNIHPIRLSALLLLGLWGSLLMAAPRETQGPRQLIMSTAEQLVRELRAQQGAIDSDPQLAYRLADRTVVPHIDFPLIARWVAGRHWRTAMPDQRARFTQEFRQFLINTYVTAMVSYAHEIVANADNVSYPPLAPEKDPDQATVRMNIRLGSGRTVAVDYRLRRTGKGWEIYDVVVEGISLVVTYRETFSQQIATLGFDGVIDQLTTRNAAMRERLKSRTPHAPR